jgi:uncharacterized phage protein gp47/JayE
MNPFNMKTWEQITASLVNFFCGGQPVITDMNIGGIARTLLESYAMELEELYYRIYMGIQIAIGQAIYAAFGFSLLPAATAHGSVTFTSTYPAPVVGIAIPLGTIVQSQSGVIFTVDGAGAIAYGDSTYVAAITAQTTGITGNVGTGSITVLPTPVPGIASITNVSATGLGADAETESQRALRFTRYIASLSRGTIGALLYAAIDLGGAVDAAVLEPPIPPATPIVTPTGTPGATTYTYYLVAKNEVGGGIPSFPATTTTGNAALNSSNYNHVTWTAVPLAQTYDLLVVDGGEIKSIATALTDLFFSDEGGARSVYAFDPRGVVNVYARDTSNALPSPLYASVLAQLNAYRAAGVYVTVQAPSPVALDVVGTVSYNPSLDPIALAATIQALIIQFFAELNIGNDFVLEALRQAIYNVVPGIRNVILSSPAADQIIRPSEIAVLNSQTIALAIYQDQV